MTEQGAIKVERTIRAPRQRVWEELTVRSRIEEWLCDQALIEARAGGHYLFRWRSGFEAQGTLVRFEPPQAMALVWIGTGEPGQTLVEWQLAETAEGTRVTLTHDGFGRDPRGQASRVEAAKEWPGGLENLQAVLEEGLVEGGAAAEAEVKKGDVIVALDGAEVAAFNDLVAAVQPHHAGDTVHIGLVRGRERLTVPLTLRGRPKPPDPGTLAETVAGLREAQGQVRTQLAQIIAGLDEELAGKAPAEGEWSVKELLAHLSGAERDMQANLLHLVVGFQLSGEPDFSAALDRTAAVLAAEPTFQGLLARFDRDMEESVLHVERLSPVTVADRYRYRQALELIFGFVDHAKEHLEQMRRTVEMVGKK